MRTTDQSYSTAKQRDKIEQPGYKEEGNRCAAVEGVCSSIKNRFQAAKMKVRGKMRVGTGYDGKGVGLSLNSGRSLSSEEDQGKEDKITHNYIELNI
nr:hypothetical protein [Pasteuria penetrans]